MGLVVAMFVILGLLFGGGAGWFAWRKFVLPKRPELLVEKAGAGDLTALATLGLSHLRGEWGAELDFVKGRAMVERAANGGDPLGLLALGLLRSNGLPAPDSRENLREAAEVLWREAMEKGAVAAAAERNDPRWIALAVDAENELMGAVSEQSIQLLEKAVDADYPSAAMVMASLAHTGEEKAKWLTAAERFARKAVSKNSVNAVRILGALHLAGELPDSDRRFGREQLEKAADAGDPLAALELANHLLEEGSGREAVAFAEAAWEAGLVPAAAILGEIHFDGKGVDRDPSRGVKLAAEAAEVGYVRGLAVVARAHSTGEGAELDPRKAERIWRDLIESGFTNFNADLGIHLAADGRTSEAIDPLRVAAGSGNAEAAMKLGTILADAATGEDAFAEAVSWLEKAARANIAGASVALAETIDHPKRERRDPSRAVELLKELSDEGDHRSAVRLARFYLEGRGVTRDPTKAMLLLTKAAEAGEASSYFLLAEFHEKGAGTLPASPAAALEYYRKALSVGDIRVAERFSGMETGRSVLTAFLESWVKADARATLAWIGGEVSEYFLLSRPDSTQIASLEEGFRALWPTRRVTAGRIEATALVALDRIEFRVPYRLDFSRNGQAGAANAVATAEVVFPENGSPRITRFSEKVETWQLEPTNDRFDREGDRATTRGILPAMPVGESAIDFANLPRKEIESVRAIPLRDKFGRQHGMLPVAIDAGLVSFARLSGGGELLMPVSYFDESVRERIQNVVDGQSFAEFEKLRDGLILGPDRSDPATLSLLRRAEGGDHEAEALVGEAYYDGLGTFPKNRVEAGKWFVRSANGRHLLGQVWVAILTRDGEFGGDVSARDRFRDLVFQMSEAINLSSQKVIYMRAAAECHAGAYGEDPFDNRAARNLLEQASAGGDSRAKVLLGVEYARTGSTLAVGPLRTAADNRCASAATELAKYYLGTGRNHPPASDHLRLAANKGDIEAQALLGEFLARGGDGPGRESEAAFWLELALRNAVSTNRKQHEAVVRSTMRALADLVDEESFRRARYFLEKKPSTVVEPR